MVHIINSKGVEDYAYRPLCLEEMLYFLKKGVWELRRSLPNNIIPNKFKTSLHSRCMESVEKSIDNFFYYLREAERQVKDVLLKDRYTRRTKAKKFEKREGREKVFVCGMGGSGIAGRILRDLLLSMGKNIDVEVLSSYALPSYATKDDHYIFISYSGNTEETLSCFEHALKKADKQKIITITRGGKLKEKADKEGVKVIKVKRNMMPRSSLPYLFVFSLYALVMFLLLDEKEAGKVVEEILALEEDKEEMKEKGREMARHIGNHIVVSYGWGKYKGAMYRAKTQFNENAKHPAFYEELSESNHNFIQVFDTPRKSMLEQLVHIFVIDRESEDKESKRIKGRISFLLDAIKKKGGESIVLEVNHKGAAGIFYVIYVLDCASAELGKMKGVDVEEVSIIEELKKYLKNL